MIKLCILSIVSLLLIVFFKEVKPEYALFIKLASISIISVILLRSGQEAASDFFSFCDTYSIDSSLLQLLIKAVGICLVSQICANLCKDSGESALATIIELAGRIGIFILSLPLASELLKITVGWLNP